MVFRSQIASGQQGLGGVREQIKDCTFSEQQGIRVMRVRLELGLGLGRGQMLELDFISATTLWAEVW